MRIFSFGGGVQSTAVMVLAAQGKVQFDEFVFANTGDDSESPKTLAYLRTITKDYADKHGLKFIEVHKKKRDGSPHTLYGNLTARKNNKIAIPVYLPGGGGPGSRKCTSDWKIKVIAQYVKREKKATAKDQAIVGIGISTDEWHRAKDSNIAWIKNIHPLLELKLNRKDCANIIRDAGLPVPPKSSCWFCPYKRQKEWRDMANNDPVLFQQCVDLEKILTEKYKISIDRMIANGKDDAKSVQLYRENQKGVFLTGHLKPLDEAIQASGQQTLFDDECSGYCWT